MSLVVVSAPVPFPRHCVGVDLLRGCDFGSLAAPADIAESALGLAMGDRAVHPVWPHLNGLPWRADRQNVLGYRTRNVSTTRPSSGGTIRASSTSLIWARSS